MGTKQIRRLEPEIFEESSHTFSKESDGLFRKISWKTLRDGKTGKKTTIENTVSEELYRPVSGDDYDYCMDIIDINGEEYKLKFKRVEDPEK